jgi:hypothetical protein
MAAGFQTFQTVKNYDDALGRHGQWVRWLKGTACPCVDKFTSQPDPRCSFCKGRGFVYRNPDGIQVLQENAKHDGSGNVYPKNTPITSVLSVTHQGSELSLSSTQPADGGYVKLEPPYLKPYQRIKLDYVYSPEKSIDDENSEVIDTNLIRTVSTRFTDKGKAFTGSIERVTKVYNVSRDENYTVSFFARDFIYLQSMGSWESGDVLEVSYVYVSLFYFVISGVTPKMKYDRAYIMENADAILIAPSWIILTADDLFTAMAQEVSGRAIVNPGVSSGNDSVVNVFDMSRVTYLLDNNHVEYTQGINFEVVERNQIKWITTKPTVPYVIEYLYHPTYRAIGDMSTVRNAENKHFANRINVKLYNGSAEGIKR